MNFAVYYPWIYLRSGAERHIAELCDLSRHRWTVFTNRYEPEVTFPNVRSNHIVELRRVSVKRSFLHAASAALTILLQRLPLKGHDGLLVMCEGMGDLITFRNHQLPTVCFCMTPLRAAFDDSYQSEYLRRHDNRLLRRLALRSAGACFRALDRRAWKNYSHIAAVSQEVRDRILRGRLADPSRISVLNPGVNCQAIQPSGRFERTFLIPGRIMWTKNLELGIDAFRSLLVRRPDLADFQLTIAGFVDRKSRPYIAHLRERAAGCRNIHFIEGPSDEELFGLYRSTYAVVYTPFNEDFGLVPLEGMAHGKPVIAVNRGGPRETVLNDHTGFLLEPTAEAFSHAMEALADDPECVRRMGVAAHAHCQKFDYRRFYRALDQYLEDAVEMRSRVSGRLRSVSLEQASQ